MLSALLFLLLVGSFQHVSPKPGNVDAHDNNHCGFKNAMKDDNITG